MECQPLKLFLFISSFCFLFAASGQDSLSVDSTSIDSLNTYQFPDFRNIDSSFSSIYPFIQYDYNNYSFHSPESKNFQDFYEKWNKMVETKKGKLNFYHIGGSHLQADIYSHDVRAYLQTNWDNLPGERGWVFPFDLAQTNNPGNYEFSSPNTWKGYRCVNHRPSKYDVDYGVMGAMTTCKDSVITIYFKHDRTIVKPPINHIRIFHNIGEFPYWNHFGGNELLVTRREHDPVIGATDIYFSDDIDTFNLQFQRTEANAPELEIYGFLLLNDHPGISYSSIGINGAGLYTYLRNTRFEDQLKEYPPDFFSYSVGTNDGNVPYSKFKPLVYKKNLERMMQIALRANPDCALLLTVPNDSYYRRRYLNKNIDRERTVIIELAEEYGMAVWDMYGIMGGLGSSRTWKNNKLMRSDLIHFTHEGYHFKGDLFFDGFLKYLDQMEQFNNPISH